MHNASFTKVRDVVEYFNAGISQDPLPGPPHPVDPLHQPSGAWYAERFWASRKTKSTI